MSECTNLFSLSAFVGVIGVLTLATAWLTFVAVLRWKTFHMKSSPKIIGRLSGGALGPDMPGIGDEDDGQAAELEELNRVRKKYRHWRSEVTAGADND